MTHALKKTVCSVSAVVVRISYFSWPVSKR